MAGLSFASGMLMLVMMAAIAAMSYALYYKVTYGFGGSTTSGTVPAPAPTPTPGPTPTPTQDVSFAALTQRFFVEQPQVGPHSESFWVPLEDGETGVLSRLVMRVEQTFTTDSMQFALYRYRRSTPTGAFTVTALTSIISVDNTLPFSYWNDYTSSITPSIDLDPTTDMIAVTTSYTQADPEVQSVRGINITFTVSKNE
nr:hypothetical protein [Sicyoidochytrium minutum DNA virus]